MKITITSKDGSSRDVEVESGEDIQVKPDEKFHLTPDADNPAVVILPSGTDLVVMLANGTWITLVGANDPGVVGEGGGIEVSVEGIGTVISAENSFTSYQGILLNNSLVAAQGGDGEIGSPFYEPISDLNNFFLMGLLPQPVLQGLQGLFGSPGANGLLIGDEFVFVTPLLTETTGGVEATPDEPTDSVVILGGPGCVNGSVFTGSQAGSSTLTGTACDDDLFAFDSDNSLTGLAGNDNLMVTGVDVVVADDPEANAETSDNTLSGGDGNDDMSVSASAEASTVDAFGEGLAYADANRNFLSGGDGNDTMSVSVDTNVDAAVDEEVEGFAEGFAEGYADDNTLSGGDGNDVMSVSADTNVSADAYVYESTTAGADASADASAASYYAAAIAEDNSLSGGGGNDVMSVTANTDVYVNAEGYAYADGEGVAYAFGEGIAYAYANDNTLSGGDGNDVMSVSADVENYAGAAAAAISEGAADADALSEGYAYADANRNSLSGGGGNDDMSVSAFAASDASALAEGYSYNDDYGNAYADAQSYASADAYRNTLSGGGGNDVMSVIADANVDVSADGIAYAEGADYSEGYAYSEGDAYADADRNSLTGGDGNDNMTVSATANARSDGDASGDYGSTDTSSANAIAGADRNTLSGGVGNDVMSVSADSTASAYGNDEALADSEATANNNELDGGAGNDMLEVTADSFAYSDYGYNYSIDSYAAVIGNTLQGDGGNDTLTVRASDTSNPGTSPISIRAVVKANVIMGGDGNDILAAISEATYIGAGGGVYNNSLYGGADDDQLTVRSDTQTAQQLINNNVLDGGADVDTLSVDAAGDVINAGGITDIEVLDLNNGEANAISLDGGDVNTMLGGPVGGGTLRVESDAMDTWNMDDWLATANPASAGYTVLQSVSDNTIYVEVSNVASGLPIVLDLNGDGIAEFTQIGGNRFDVDGDGELENISWAGAGDAVLAFDANGDGMISSMEEIAFASYVPGATSDLEGLRAFDTNNDGLLSAEDDDFGSFFVWQESNFDGVGSGLELMSLADAGIQSINLELLNDEGFASGQGFVQGIGEFTWDDGTTGELADAIFLSQEDPVDLGGVLDVEPGGAAEDEALIAAVDDDGSGGGGSGDEVPILPEAPADGIDDPLNLTEEELAAV